jgi:hypothetical protein
MAMISEQRLRQSLVEQVQSERLAGNRAESLKVAAEAARIKSAPELRQKAAKTITISSVRLLREVKGIKVAFSPDGKMLAVLKPQKREGKVTGSLPAEIELLETQTGRLLDRFNIDYIPWQLLFSPDGSRLMSNDVGKIGMPTTLEYGGEKLTPTHASETSGASGTRRCYPCSFIISSGSR